MKVKELTQILNQMPQDAEVIVSQGTFYSHITNIVLGFHTEVKTLKGYFRQNKKKDPNSICLYLD